MGKALSALRLENENQINWRIVQKKRTLENEEMQEFHDLYILRGGKGRVSLCPDLYWQDLYSLVDLPENLNSYFQCHVKCFNLFIWNFNGIDLKKPQDRWRKKDSSTSTDYMVVLPKLLTELSHCNLQPTTLRFFKCDFANCPLELMKEFMLSQVGRLEEVEFGECTNLPFPEDQLQKEIDGRKKLSIATVESFDMGDAEIHVN